MPRVTSLNFNFRNKVSEKIMEENEKILQKLRAKGATFSVKKLNDDYKLSLQYKKNLSRRQFNSPNNKLQKKLPKIERVSANAKKFKKEEDFKHSKSEADNVIATDNEEHKKGDNKEEKPGKSTNLHTKLENPQKSSIKDPVPDQTSKEIPVKTVEKEKSLKSSSSSNKSHSRKSSSSSSSDSKKLQNNKSDSNSDTD